VLSASHLLLPLAAARCARRSPLVFDPRLPAPLRVLALAASAVFSLYVAAAYAPAFAGRRAAISLGATVALALLSGFALVAFYFLALHALIAPFGARQWATRFPVLSAELARRRAGGGGWGEEGGEEEDPSAPPSGVALQAFSEEWGQVVAADADARSSGPPSRAGWRARAPAAALLAAFAFFAFAAYAAELLRGRAAVLGALGAWVLGSAAAAPLAVVCEGAWVAAHLLVLPFAAPALRILLPRAAFARVDPDGAPPAGEAVAGRLEALLFGVAAAAAEVGGGRGARGAEAAAAAVVLSAPLIRVVQVLCGGAAASLGAVGGRALAARLRVAADTRAAVAEPPTPAPPSRPEPYAEAAQEFLPLPFLRPHALVFAPLERAAAAGAQAAEPRGPRRGRLVGAGAAVVAGTAGAKAPPKGTVGEK
jgi:hypothetical protein